MVLVCDRAQGVAAAGGLGEIVVNLDRKAGEDGKGVGEYLSVENNSTIRHQIKFCKPS